MKKGDYQYGLFPLRIFLFPGEQTTLHIFEPRYRQLVTECLSSGEYFGIPYQGRTTLSELGSLVKVVQILKKYDSGDLDVLVECKSNFKIHHFQNKNEHKLYPIGSLSKIKKSIFNPSEELEKYASEYLAHLLDNSKESKSEMSSKPKFCNIFSAFSISWLNLSALVRSVSLSVVTDSIFFGPSIKALNPAKAEKIVKRPTKIMRIIIPLLFFFSFCSMLFSVFSDMMDVLTVTKQI